MDDEGMTKLTFDLRKLAEAWWALAEMAEHGYDAAGEAVTWEELDARLIALGRITDDFGEICRAALEEARVRAAALQAKR